MAQEANVTARPQLVQTPQIPHCPHEDELALYRDLTYSNAKLFLSHALCLKRHSTAFASPEAASDAYHQLLRTVFTELLQWLPHRSVNLERGEAFYSDESCTKVLSIAHIRGVGGNSVRTLKHQRAVELGWILTGTQFRGVFNKLTAQSFFCISFELQWKPDKRMKGDVRDHAMVTYQIGEVGKRNQKGMEAVASTEKGALAHQRQPAAGWSREWWS